MLSGGGMVGGLGDNRNSPTWVNSALSRGFFDATWPETAPSFGSSASIRRIGDILNHGKLYLLTQIGVAQTAGEIVLDGVLGEWIMWHAFGDPTLELWTGNPYRLVLTTEVLVQALPDRLHAYLSRRRRHAHRAPARTRRAGARGAGNRQGRRRGPSVLRYTRPEHAHPALGRLRQCRERRTQDEPGTADDQLTPASVRRRRCDIDFGCRSAVNPCARGSRPRSRRGARRRAGPSSTAGRRA